MTADERARAERLFRLAGEWLDRQDRIQAQVRAGELSRDEASAAYGAMVRSLNGGLSLDEQEDLQDSIDVRAHQRLKDRVLELEDRLAAVDQRGGVPFDVADRDEGPVLRWLGSWTPVQEYRAGHVTAHRNTLYIAVATSRGTEPGREDGEPRAWKIMLRRPDLRPAARDRR
jgi:hypothetical protein